MNQNAGEEPQTPGSTGGAAREHPDAGGPPETDPAGAAGAAEAAEAAEAAVELDNVAWPEPPSVPPEPDPAVATSPVVVPAIASHRISPHPLITDAARAWRTGVTHARLSAIVRQRRSGEDGEEPRPRTRPAGRPRGPRQPWVVLPSIILVSLVAAFFAWVSAEPFWLAVGHGETGVATVVKDRGGGIGQRCLGNFAATGGRFEVKAVPVTGVDEARCATGATIGARMVSASGREAYGGNGAGLTVRWGIGFLLVAACALLIVRLSGAARFAGRERVAAVTMTFSAPLIIMIGILAATF